MNDINKKFEEWLGNKHDAGKASNIKELCLLAFTAGYNAAESRWQTMESAPIPQNEVEVK